MYRKITALVWCVVTFGAFATEFPDYAPMNAQFKLASKTILYPEPDEEIDRVAIQVTGQPAKTIYDAMPAAGKLDKDCIDDGVTREKIAGGLKCIAYKDGDYACWVGIMLDTGETKIHVAC